MTTFVTVDPRAGGLDGGIGATVLYVNVGKSAVLLFKYAAGDTEWCTVPGNVGGQPVTDDPRVGGLDMPSRSRVLYVSAGAGSILFKYGAGSTEWCTWDGSAGAAGATGSAGASGPPGSDGLDGADGIVGLTGASGPAGTPGASGPTGPAGPAGWPGDDGDAGLDGQPGMRGADGAAGTAGAAGAVGSSGPMGSPGDEGPEGPEGPAGNVGPTGAQGTAGSAGAVGPAGTPGMRGEDGADGADGMFGAQGPAGTVGAPGATGSAGSAGVPGWGEDGVDGADGLPGVAGPAGTVGTPGTAGSTGLPGWPGADGADGADGLDGPPGPRGADGAAGGGASPAGAGTEVQYRNAGAFGAAARESIDASGNPRIDAATTWTAPAAGKVALLGLTLAAKVSPGYVGPAGTALSVQPHLGRGRIGVWSAAPNNASVPAVFGFLALTAVGTPAARAPATTNMLTRVPRITWASTAIAGALASLRHSVVEYSIGDGAGLGGFFFIARFACGDAATVAGRRSFLGWSSATTAPTNVNPSTLTNSFGVAQIDGSTNLQMVYGGSAAQTPVDLGANFPANTLSVDYYELALYANPATSNTVDYTVTRLNTGHVATGQLTGTAGTALPLSSTFLAFRYWACNNATALAVSIDLASVYVETDY